jgi:hypothetical protein
MNAKEMFEKLEFKERKDVAGKIWFETHRDWRDQYITFYLNSHLFWARAYDEFGESTPFEISIELYRAITQQMEELGWLK